MAVRPIDGTWSKFVWNLGEKSESLARKFRDGKACLIDLRLAVEAQPTLAPPNEPLTLEQLREMDGEPVWFDTIKRWGIVKVNREGIFVVTKSGEYEFGRCKVYRRPPEGEVDGK